MKHNFLKSLFTTLLLFCCTIVSAYDFEVDGIHYKILSEEEKTVEVTSGEKEYRGAVTIPESIIYNNTNYNVTSIRELAFYECSLSSIEIPGSITSIGKSAFYYCEGLTSIEIPDNVTNIGDETFAFCKSLTRYLKQLVERNLIEYKGSDKTGGYYPKE